MVLAIGLVVDDAIVVLENIFRHIEEGMQPFQAAIKGAREISFAVVAMTLTLAAVFAPLAFTPGRTGRLFAEFALTLAGAVIVSGFVALTLTPMMCSAAARTSRSRAVRPRMERGFVRHDARLQRSLRWSLARRWIVVGADALVAGGGSAWLFTTCKAELAPMEDRGVILAHGAAPRTAPPLDYTARYLRRFESVAAAGSGSRPPLRHRRRPCRRPSPVLRTCRLGPSATRTHTADRARAAAAISARLPGVIAFPMTPPQPRPGFARDADRVRHSVSGQLSQAAGLVGRGPWTRPQEPGHRSPTPTCD